MLPAGALGEGRLAGGGLAPDDGLFGPADPMARDQQLDADLQIFRDRAGGKLCSLERGPRKRHSGALEHGGRAQPGEAPLAHHVLHQQGEVGDLHAGIGRGGCFELVAGLHRATRAPRLGRE